MKRVKSRLAILMAELDPRMSQRELAEKSGVSAMAVNRLYNNDFKRVDTETLEKLCAYLECDLSDLLVLKEEQPPKKNSAQAIAHSKKLPQPKANKLHQGATGNKKSAINEQKEAALSKPLGFKPRLCKQPHSKPVVVVVPSQAREMA